MLRNRKKPVPFWITFLFFNLLLLSGCLTSSGKISQSWRTFLRTPYPGVNQWLEERITLDLHYIPMWKLAENKTLRFDIIPMLLLGQQANYELITVEDFKGSRREFFWRLHKQYGLVFDLIEQNGIVTLRVRSPEFIQLFERASR